VAMMDVPVTTIPPLWLPFPAALMRPLSQAQEELARLRSRVAVLEEKAALHQAELAIAISPLGAGATPAVAGVWREHVRCLCLCI
jgi:hypothetical protein